MMLFSIALVAVPGQKAMAVYGSKGFPPVAAVVEDVVLDPGVHGSVGDQEAVTEQLRKVLLNTCAFTYADEAVVEIPDHQRVAAPGVFGLVVRAPPVLGKDVVVDLGLAAVDGGLGPAAVHEVPGSTRCRKRGWPLRGWGRRTQPQARE